MFGYTYLTQGTKNYEEYTGYGLWFAKDEATAINEIKAWNNSNGVQTKSIEVVLVDRLPFDVRVDHLGRLVR